MDLWKSIFHIKKSTHTKQSRNNLTQIVLRLAFLNLTSAVSSNFATANNDGSLLLAASSMLSLDKWQRASIKYFTEESLRLLDDSKSLKMFRILRSFLTSA